MTESTSAARRAVLHTNHGDITVDLFPDHAPKTVANFADLAEGAREWTHPETRAEDHRQALRRHDLPPDHLRLHDPGRGPARAGLRRPGLPVRRRVPPRPRLLPSPTCWPWRTPGPGTNGSQFFITLGPTPHLNRKHTIFGEVADQASRDVVDAIGKVADRPQRQARRRRRHRVRRGAAQLTEHPAGAPDHHLLPPPGPADRHRLRALRSADLPRVHGPGLRRVPVPGVRPRGAGLGPRPPAGQRSAGGGAPVGCGHPVPDRGERRDVRRHRGLRGGRSATPRWTTTWGRSSPPCTSGRSWSTWASGTGCSPRRSCTSAWCTWS